ncbi:hypothetical protein CC80DRAFT_458535 [Byssothecium circinans]|uniref:N-acetyltransferase domain-containing protein n=1 Tax=Byssothecium circinans TaxID=147558 RepID=A0A6A5T827_9PLEO|nr:hypothetical protein CC80DRAFT_458535 [Byssothecium circinans]
MATQSQFLVREVENVDGDGLFITSAFDAALPFLHSIGSHDQWGSTPFSHQQGWAEETLRRIREAKQNYLAGNGNSDGLRIFIVERVCSAQVTDVLGAQYRIAVDGRRLLSVGFAFVRENWFPSYITAQEHLHMGEAERGAFLYLEVIVTDSRVGNIRRGAGASLIRSIRDYGRSRGKTKLYLDSWAGNDRKLVKYYEQQGFEVVGDFELPRANKIPWLGTLMRINI